LLRHGETDWNVLGKIQGGGFDIPLNDNGRQQAFTTALALEDIPLGVVASSHLSRAKETADILWERHGETVQDRRVILNGLAEMRFGEFEGLAWRDQEVDPALAERFKTISRELKQDVDKAFPGGGESTRDVQIRSTEALHQILKDHPHQQHIAIVSHGRTNKVLIAATAMGDVMKFRDVKQSSKSTGSPGSVFPNELVTIHFTNPNLPLSRHLHQCYGYRRRWKLDNTSFEFY
jgi:broad specificity phosphatase PhoE